MRASRELLPDRYPVPPEEFSRLHFLFHFRLEFSAPAPPPPRRDDEMPANIEYLPGRFGLHSPGDRRPEYFQKRLVVIGERRRFRRKSADKVMHLRRAQ